MIYTISRWICTQTLLFFFQNKVRSFIVCWVYQNILLLAMANGTFFMGALVLCINQYIYIILDHGTRTRSTLDFVPPSRCEVCGHVIARHRFIPVGHGSTAWSRTDIIQDLKILWCAQHFFISPCDTEDMRIWHPFRSIYPDQHTTKTRYIEISYISWKGWYDLPTPKVSIHVVVPVSITRDGNYHHHNESINATIAVVEPVRTPPPPLRSYRDMEKKYPSCCVSHKICQFTTGSIIKYIYIYSTNSNKLLRIKKSSSTMSSTPNATQLQAMLTKEIYTWKNHVDLNSLLQIMRMQRVVWDAVSMEYKKIKKSTCYLTEEVKVQLNEVTVLRLKDQLDETQQEYYSVCCKLSNVPDPAILLTHCKEVIESQSLQILQLSSTNESLNGELEQAEKVDCGIQVKGVCRDGQCNGSNHSIHSL